MKTRVQSQFAEKYGKLKTEVLRNGQMIAQVYVQVNGQERIDWLRNYATSRGITDAQALRILVNELITIQMMK